jgi:broad specificity phosphatase PhoE
MIFDLIFVRHGQSCANAWQLKYYGSHIFYKDPELSQLGIDVSKMLGLFLQEHIAERWSNEPFTIGASRMIRAQETAFYMLAHLSKNPINVFPHIAEHGVTLDNWSELPTEQYALMHKRNPDVCKLITRGQDYREPQSFRTKSNWDLFMQWAVANPDAFSKGTDNKYRAVIFSHGHFLQSVFDLPHSMNNNDALNTVINTGIDYTTPRYEYWPLNRSTSATACPDKCISSPCSVKRASKKKSSRSTRKIKASK